MMGKEGDGVTGDDSEEKVVATMIMSSFVIADGACRRLWHPSALHRFWPSLHERQSLRPS